MAIGFVCALQHWMVYPQKLVMKSQEVWDGRTSAAQSGAIVFILVKPPPLQMKNPHTMQANELNIGMREQWAKKLQ